MNTQDFTHREKSGIFPTQKVSFLSPNHSVLTVKLSLVSVVSTCKYVVLLVESITIKSLTEGG